MKFDTETATLGFCETVYDSTAEETLETEFNLPDYCPEIKKIIRCSLKTDVNAVQKQDGKITAMADAYIRLLYIGDNDKLSFYEQTYPVQKIVESDKINLHCAVTVKVNTEYVNCRATNPRRVDIKAMMTFAFKAVCKREENVLSSVSGAGVQTLNREFEFSDLKVVSEKSFNLTEVIELNSNKPAISRIINSSAYVVTSSKKIINNKMLLKGDCYIKSYYISENDCEIECAEHSIPVSQIIEVEGINDTCDTDIDISITACEAIAKVDSSGDTRLIDINIRVSVKVFAFETKTVSLISDAFSTECETQNNSKHISIIGANTDFDNSFINKLVLESIGVSVERVKAVWCDELKYSSTFKNNVCLFSGSYQANIIYIDAEKVTGIIKKPVDFEYKVDLKNPASSIDCRSTLQLCSCSCSVVDESKLELKTEMMISGKIFSTETVRYVSDIEIKEKSDSYDDRCALTIYFCDKKEKVWDIAKKYKTTAEAIIAENDLDNDLISERKILLIPCE